MFSFCRNKSAEKDSYTPSDVEPGDINSYIEKRLNAQIRWYSKKSREAQKNYKRLQVIELVLAALIPLLVHGLPHGFTQMMISSIVLFYLRIYSNLLLNFVNMVFSMIIYPKPITKTGVMTLTFIIAMTLLQKISLIFCIDFSF